jgi:hypothetical protein
MVRRRRVWFEWNFYENKSKPGNGVLMMISTIFKEKALK